MKSSLIDDVSSKMSQLRGKGGYSILFYNPEIRRMLTLAGASKKDIFYDLGCGLGQNLKIALTEFHVKKAVGIERNQKRAKKADHRLTRLNFATVKHKIVCGNFEKLVKGKLKDASLKEATIVFYGLSSDPELISDMAGQLKKGCKLVFYDHCLIPEVQPTKRDYPFYLAVAPLRKPKSALQWLREVVFWQRSSIYKKKTPNESELWDELRHDLKLMGNLPDFADYQNRLRETTKS